VSTTSLSKQIARYTKSVRISLGLARPELRAHADGRIEPSLIARGTTGARLRAVETDLARLTQGWNQHIPQLLSVTAEARVRAHEAASSYGRLDEFAATLVAMKAEIATLESRIDSLKASAIPAAPDRASAGRKAAGKPRRVATPAAGPDPV